MKCSHCGELFKGNPRSQPLGRADYCSVMCEEGKGPLPIDDPASPDYHLYLKGNPEDLVGKSIIACGLKYVDFSPDWCKGPHYTTPSRTIACNEREEWYIRRDEVFLGTVVEYGADGYVIEHEDSETGEITERTVHDFLMVEQLKEERWWADG